MHPGEPVGHRVLRSRDMPYKHGERLQEHAPSNYNWDLGLLYPDKVTVIRLQQERFASQIVPEMTYSIEGRVRFLLEGIPARSNVGELLAGKPIGSWTTPNSSGRS